MSELITASDGRIARGNRTRVQLLASALKLFGERGFFATTMKDLAHEAGVSPPAVYNHFDSKESVLFAALTWGLQKFQDYVIDNDDSELDPTARLEGVVRRHARHQIKFARRAEFADRLLDAVAAGELLTETQRDIITGIRANYHDLVDSLILQVAATSDSRTPPTHMCRAAILNLCDRSPQWVNSPQNATGSTSIEDDVWFLVQGMLRI
ncbi:TetR/AcrR family transcriptional regulator [Rhodococcus sp. 06-156-3C]|uniref:TetR/AcrR family transcriptional regulator n=1 Tax=Nocardiaceae TaxID=85025 RepID=UPI00068B2302|nr:MULTISPECIES: TetR/AcrR family transcriptional regulator [Rhodococcus]OZD18263.1 TetR/AcrR family transcriptional regulator [Rhodococcus sp. 06-156-4C]OZD18861.1 TetR/AcrR family transcriptional regulator [Rhodococcus sp. 06-156-3C]OZD22371.1 TetR/AcrR family transcriptional regulator [Rhodococcus sp. 06-156-4a]OZD33955.1 TetR/AcrR family transcriptional regulator [Rhodococcus sp. 06-156-3b]OZD38692.1 TetR/AcrR family transcriptional regulator [Rhodococcus sp. 06-156-3]